MSENLGKGVSYVAETQNRSISKVVFRQGKPVLDTELNLAQEASFDMLRKVASEAPSGWSSPRAPYVTGRDTYFISQNSNDKTPEMAFVAGMPIEVSASNAAVGLSGGYELSNTIDMTNGGKSLPPTSGTRVDGVFLEAWREVVGENLGSPAYTNTAPDLKKVATFEVSGVGTKRSLRAVAVGTSGTIIYSSAAEDPIEKWVELRSPTNLNLNSVAFRNATSFVVVGDKGVAFRTDDLGDSWVALETNTRQNINDVYISGTAEITLVCDTGLVLTSTNPGNTLFTQVPLFGAGSTGNIRSISGFSGVRCIVGNSGYVAYLASTGFSRSLIRKDGNVVTANITDVSIVNQVEAWAVSSDGILYRSTDGCRSFFSVDGSILGTTQSTSLTSAINGKSLSYVKVLRNDPVAVRMSLNSAVYKTATYEVVPGGIVISWFKYPDASTGAIESGKTTVHWNDKPTSGVSDPSSVIIELLKAAKPDGEVATPSYIPYFFPEVTLEWVPTLDTNYGGTVPSIGYANLSFSATDTVIVGGAGGICYRTDDSGLSWTLDTAMDNSTLNDFVFLGRDRGVAVGNTKSILFYSRNNADKLLTGSQVWSGVWFRYPADNANKVDRRMYFNGNILAPEYLNPVNDSIHPQTMVETSTREQVQYRIRVVPNVNPSIYQESGLGDKDVLSYGSGTRGYGSPFENMGAINGDYGCWRATCLSSADGYSYAIPMFLVQRRNSSLFDPVSNPNGVGGSHPSGMVDASVILPEDVVDVRKDVFFSAGAGLLGTAVSDLLSNRTISNFNSSKEGVVASYVTSDNTTGPNAFLEVDSPLVVLPAESNTLPVNKDLSLVVTIPGTLTDSHYSFDPSSYKAYYTSASGTKKVFQGVITGMGSKTAKLVTVSKNTKDSGFTNPFGFSADSNANPRIGTVSASYGTTDVFIFGESVLVSVGANPANFAYAVIKAGLELEVGGQVVTVVKDSIVKNGEALLELSSSISITEADLTVRMLVDNVLVLDPEDETQVYKSISLFLGALNYGSAGTTSAPVIPMAIFTPDGKAYQSVGEQGSKVVYVSANTSVSVSSALSKVGASSPFIVVTNVKSTLSSDYSQTFLKIPALIPTSGGTGMFAGHIISVSEGGTEIPLDLSGNVDGDFESGYVRLYYDGSSFYYEVKLNRSYFRAAGTNFTVVLSCTNEMSNPIFPVSYPFTTPSQYTPNAAILSTRKHTVMRIESASKVTGVNTTGTSLGGIYAPAATLTLTNGVSGITYVGWVLDGDSSAYLKQVTVSNSATDTVVRCAYGNATVCYTSNSSGFTEGSLAGTFSSVYGTIANQGISLNGVSLEVLSQPERGYLFTAGRGPGVESGTIYSSPLAQLPLNVDSKVSPRIVGNTISMSVNGKSIANGSYTATLVENTGITRDISLSSGSVDADGKPFFAKASSLGSFSLPPCDYPIPRVMMTPFLAVVRGGSTGKVLDGEVVLCVVSSYLVGTDNVLNIGPNGSAVVSIYKMSRPPLVR